MAIQYHSLTQEEMDDALAETIHAREVEHFHYDTNRRNYEALLATPEMKGLPEWPAHLEQYKGATRDQVVGALAGNRADCDLVLALQHRDRLRHLLQTEAHEMAKVEKYHAQAVALVPEGRRKAALERARARRNGG